MTDDDDFVGTQLANNRISEFDDGEGDDAQYYEIELSTPCVVEEPDDAAYESAVAAQEAAHDALIAEMKRDEEKEEAKRTTPRISKAAPKRRSAQSAAPRKRANSAASSDTSKIGKMRAKQMKNVMRDAEKIIKATVVENESEDVRKVRTEALHAQQQAMAAARELQQLCASVDRTKEAMKYHSEMTAKLRKMHQLQTSSEASVSAINGMHDMILETCIDAQTDLTSSVTKLHERVNKLVHLYSNIAAKCEAVTRRHFESGATPFAGGSGVPQARNAELAVLDKDHAVATEATASSSTTVATSDQTTPTNGTSSLFSLRTANGFYSLATRPAPQIVRGRPGSHYVAFSVARRKGSAQQLAQSDTILRAQNVQRWATLAKKRRTIMKLVGAMPHMNGEDEVKRLEAATTSARIEAAKAAPKPRARKRLKAAEQATIENGDAKKPS